MKKVILAVVLSFICMNSYAQFTSTYNNDGTSGYTISDSSGFSETHNSDGTSSFSITD